MEKGARSLNFGMDILAIYWFYRNFLNNTFGFLNANCPAALMQVAL